MFIPKKQFYKFLLNRLNTAIVGGSLKFRRKITKKS